MRIPTSYKQLSVEQYQQIEPLINGNLDDQVKILSILSGLSVAEIEAIEIKKVRRYFVLLSFLKSQKWNKNPKKYLFIKGKLYRATTDAEMLNTARYVSISTLMQENKAIENLTDIGALCYEKLTWKGFKYSDKYHKELSKELKKQSIKNIYPVVFFCLRALLHLSKTSVAYLEAEKVIQERIQEIMDLIQEGILNDTGDGNTL